ncbi:MAG TPA: hypothetical protein VMT29_09000 [Steroidobacteraceae bacterium]|nr:hypothetical protein [Steroidobacteraceae bacterium]
MNWFADESLPRAPGSLGPQGPQGPLVTSPVHDALVRARDSLRAARASDAPAQSARRVRCSLDLGRSESDVEVGPEHWGWNGQLFPYLPECKERTIYHWDGEAFRVASRYAGSLIKLVPTPWGPPTFEIDGIKMLPTERVSPWDDAERKVALVRPRGKLLLDTCGGLGYFAACGLKSGAAGIRSYEKNADVIWLRSLNPWSPRAGGPLNLIHADVVTEVATLPADSVDAILHDPPRFGIAGELYSEDLYQQLARVLRRKGLLYHYTGAPNRLTSGRDVAREVAARLRRAGFAAQLAQDGVLAVREADR